MFGTRLCNKLLRPGFRLASTNNDEIVPTFTNRNPRNLERLRIGYKPNGYYVDRKGKCFWHDLRFNVSGRYATASVVHFQNGEVLRASTQEWCIQKQLYKTKDTAAYMNLARVLAQRCLQSGIIEMSCSIIPQNKEGKVALFLKTLEEEGISLTESPQYKHPQPYDLLRPEKPWEVTE